jgi:hypothetical protein
MKTKTLKQINDQKQRLQNTFFGCGKLNPAQLARFRKISNIANRYCINALVYLKGKLSTAELDEYWKVTPVPASVYASKSNL